MSLRQANSAPINVSEGELTNPADEAVLADSGALPTGQYEVFGVISASANSQVKFQRRNAANDGNVFEGVGLYVLANSSVPIAWHFFVDKNERIRIVMDDAQGAGTVWASLCVKRVA